MPGWKRFLHLVLLLGPIVLATPLAAQPTGDYTGIDLVFLVDQSGSMWGYFPDHPGKNDSYAHRVGAVQEVVVRLLDDVWKGPIVHRFSVIDFADNVEVVWSNQALRYDPKDPEALGRSVKSQLSARIRARTGAGWVNTNTPLALEKGRQELDKMAAGEPRSGRRRIVLVITDGRANKPPADVRTMRDRVVYEARLLKATGAELWVIGLNDHDYYWLDGDGAFWESLTGPGRASLADRASTSLPKVVGTTVNEWLKKKVIRVPDPTRPSTDPAAGDQYLCPPYLSRIIFRATAGIPHGMIRVLDPAGVEVPRTAGGPLSTPGTFTHFTADDPKPGRYAIEKAADRSFVISVEEVPPQLQRLLPGSEADLGVETRIVFRATTASGKALELLSKWPIHASVRITPPSGPQQEVPAESKGDGRFEATWKPTVPGVYRTELRGLVRLDDGSERDIFKAGPHAYPRELTVSRRRPLYLKLEEPQPGSGLRLAPWQRSAQVELSLQDADGRQIVDLAKQVKGAETWLSLVPLDPSGVSLGKPVPLVPGADGKFIGQMPVAFEWKRLELPSRLGNVSFRVEAQPDRLSGDQYLNSIRLPRNLEDRRIGGDPMSVGPIDVLLPRWFLGLELLLLVALLAVPVWFFAFRLLPDLAIRRQDAVRGKSVELRIYDYNEGPDAALLTLPVRGRRIFKLDGRVSLQAGDQRMVADRFRLVRLSAQGKPRARIDYRWAGKPEDHSIDLTAGSPKQLKGIPPDTGRRIMVMLFEAKPI